MLSTHETSRALRVSEADMVTYGATGRPHAAELLVDRVAAQARVAPESVALVFGERRMTYAELDRRSSQLAHALRERGVGPEVRVAVSLERGPEAVVAILAVLRAGGAFVPLDPAYPRERLAYMLADSAAALLVTSAELAADLPRGDWRLLVPEASWSEIAAQPTQAPRVAVERDSLAYVIYTSGSTGTPKGVMVTHRGIAQLALAQNAAFDIDAESRILQFAPLSFDAAVAEMATTFFAGAALVMAPRDQLLPGAALLELLRDQGITHATLPPSILGMLPPAELPALRTLVVAGEACPPALVERWGGGRRFFNAYGPTEATVCATLGECAAGEPVTIGRAIARAYVLSDDLRPVAPGTVGELCVGGDGVARGYHGRAGTTAERFIPDASGEPGARLYRTGDLVRELADGRFEYVGRMDHQVKVRGHRVELGEVESALAASPAVLAAAATAYEAADGLRTLCAYYVPARADVADEELRGWLAERLPDFMVPSRFVCLAEMPLSPSGKVERARLPHPEDGLAQASGRAPRTETERTLARIWCEVLGVDAVPADQTFVALGGHSLRAVRVLARIADVFGVRVQPHVLLRSGTIEEIAAVVEGSAARADEVPLVPVPRDRPIPLSYSQEATWFFEQFAPGLMAYRAQAVLRFRGALDVPVLERSLSEIVRRHEIFRTSFPATDGAPVQRIHAPWRVELPVHDVRADELAAFVQAEFVRPFDTSALPLVTWSLARLAADEHALVIVEHHFVHDGWSAGIFLRELRDLYRAYAEGRESPLPEPVIQFADFAVWQREWMKSEAAEAKLRYWEGALAGVPPLALPTDFPRPAVMRFRGGAERVQLSPALAAEARAFSREHGVTPFVTLLTAFQVLLGRYSGQRDFCVGSGLGNRGNVALEEVIGMVVNTVAFRADLEGDPDVLELLGRVRDVTLRAYEHQDVPFDQVVRRISPERSSGALPVYQTSFSFHDSHMADMDLGGVRMEMEEAQNNGSAKYDLQVIVIPRGEQGFAGREDETVMVWEYNTDLFHPATVRRMIGHFETLLAAMIRVPQTPISRLPLVRADERVALLDAGRATRAFPVAERVHARFEARAAERPHAPALTCEGATLTYAELNARANRLAHRLRSLGVGPETRVGIALERSAELVVSILAVLKAGGGYVPLDPAYPAERIAWVLEDAGAPVLVTTSDLVTRLPAFGGTALCIDTDAAAIAAESGENPDAAGGPDSLAYVIYTSGSTGKPKGVQVTHANVVRLFDATDEWFGIGAGDVWTLFHSCAFDFSVWEIWGALLYGGRLVVVPFFTTRSPEDFHRLLVDEGVTMLSQTPSAFRQLVQADLASGVHPSALRLRHVVFGGEALDPHSLRPWIERHGDERPRLINMYGITETTVHVTFRRVTRADLDRTGSPIGVAIPDLSLFLLDEHLEPVPAGVPGELFVGGAGVARGYLNRPELTAERFVRDPFTDGARLYRSGDLARRRSDGELEYLGRADQQVKVRGFRIETGEIEAVLAAHPAVADVAVIAREDGPGERRLVAYVVAPAGSAAPTAAELRAHVAAALPDYMVPAAFVSLDALPLTANGKLDRRALPAPEDARAAAEAYAAPRTHAEVELAAVWREVLGVERVGIDDNYFALGGDSIRAVRMVAAARRRGLAITVPQLFRQQTVRELAASAGTADAPDAQAVPFALLDADARRGLPDDVEDAYPASRVQLAMLYHTERDPASLVYLNVNGYRVHTRFDEAALREALRRLAARHPVMRSSFDLAASPPIQRVHRDVELPLEVADLRHLSADEQDAWFDRERGRGFDWTRAPLLRFLAHRVSDDAFRLILAEHHAILDGWSVASLMTELVGTYVAVRDGTPDPAGAAPAARFRDFVALERDAIASAESRAFWRDVVDGAPATALPPRAGDDAPAGEESRALWVHLPEDTAAGLRRVAEGAGVPLKTVLLAAHLRVLALLGGRSEVVTGYVTSGRPEAEDGERVLGLFLNTVPLRVDTAGATWLELVRRAWAAEEAFLPHRRFPLAEIVRDAGGRTLFEAAFSFTHFHVYDALGGVRAEGDRFFQQTEMPLVANATIDPATGAVRLRLEYVSSRLGEAQARALGDWYARACTALAERPEERWDADGLVDDEEARRLLLLGTGPAVDHEPSTVHHLFERQVARTPAAAAVIFDGKPTTYAELDAQAETLAARLRGMGVRPEVRVAVCMERTPEMVAALLAVPKAGGVCVPVDPAYPDAWIAGMMEDAAVVLTHSGLAARLSAHGNVVAVDADRDGATALCGPAALPENAAFVIHTAGSMRGVQIEHRAVVALLHTVREQASGAASISTHAAIAEIFGTLCGGGTLHLATNAELPNGIASATLAPAAAAELLRAGKIPATLRTLALGGEPLPVSLARELHAAGLERVENVYGSAEAGYVARWTVPQGAERMRVGRPGTGVRMYVLDAQLAPLPQGAAGELYVSGPGLARGYPGRPALTAERFVPDPFWIPGSRMLRTGDRVRWAADGTLEYLGRADRQAVVRGFRVEPGEVEEALRGHPSVQDAVVVAGPAPEGGSRLVAYATPRAGALDAAELRTHLRRTLPDFMVPAVFVALAAIPRTPQGRVDHAALPDPGAARDVWVAPATPTEQALAALWSEVLRTERVSASDDFFALGGDSLMAMQVLARVRRDLDCALGMRAFLEAGTLAAVAAAIDAQRAAGPALVAGVIPRRARPSAGPLA